MPKTDYYNDPAAPHANSLVPAVAAIVRNPAGDVLLIQRSDNGLWALPGGAQDIAESVTDAVTREVQEETGLAVVVTGLSGVYSDPRHVIAYDDGEVRQEFSLCFHADAVGGSLRPSTETTRVRWVSPDEIGNLRIHPAMKLRIEHGLSGDAKPYVG